MSIEAWIIVGAIVLFTWQQIALRMSCEPAERFRARFEAAFRALDIAAAEPRYCFNGERATVIDNKEFPMGKRQDFIMSIERYARNEAGEYFFFIFEGTVPFFFKHVSPSAAQAVLKEKYIALES